MDRRLRGSDTRVVAPATARKTARATAREAYDIARAAAAASRPLPGRPLHLRMFPDSGRARSDREGKPKSTPDQVALANLIRGVHF